MSAHKFRSRGPVRRTVALVGRWTEGIDGRILLREEREILWVRSSDTKIAIYWDGRLFDERATLGDFYGFLTDAQDDEPRRRAEALGLGVDDRLEVRATTTIYDVGARELPPDPNLKGWPTEYETLDLLIGSPEEFDRLQAFDWNAELPEDGWNPCRMAKADRREVGEHVVYSSKRTDAENAKALADTLSLYGVGCV